MHPACTHLEQHSPTVASDLAAADALCLAFVLGVPLHKLSSSPYLAAGMQCNHTAQ